MAALAGLRGALSGFSFLTEIFGGIKMILSG
jgi:hypothetical protein